ncbi:MAG: site-2 protease family protein [Clostridium sp.]|nr:site-2 protease family protein [Clostridium sp.]MCM1548111.1 site-2 protease family protein [Ruminococcus sp.]
MDIENIGRVLQIITKILIIFLVLPIHEYAHAWAAHKMGDDTAAYSGRLTLNPLAHIDIVGAICMLLTSFGWAKPVPINPLKFKKQRLGIALTAAAGPLSNLIVAFIATVVYRILTSLPNAYELYLGDGTGITPFFIVIFIVEFFIEVNIGLAIFNLIPIPPLDGSKVLSYFTSAKFDRWIYQNQMIVNLVFLGVIVTGILDKPISFVSDFIIDLFFFITGFIPKLMGA